MPDGLELSPQEYTPFLVAHAVGTQGYVCIKVGAAYNWCRTGRQATLFDENGEQVLTHFLSPRPYDQLLNATWQHSRDSSAVWAQVLEAVRRSQLRRARRHPLAAAGSHRRRRRTHGRQEDGQDRRIQRVNTVQGKAPTTGCAVQANIGKRALVPYEADYFFYKKNARHQGLAARVF